MKGFNKVILAGNLTRDPEMRQTQNGQNVASFSVATNHSWMNGQTGERQESVDYHNIVAWAGLAETCGKYLKKGSAILLEGRLTTRNWEAQDGSKRQTTEIIMSNMNMIGGRNDAAPATDGAYGLDQTNNAADANDGIDIPADAPAAKAPAAKNDANKIDIDEILDF